MTPPAALAPDLADACARADANSPYLRALLRRRAGVVARIGADGFDAALANAMAFDPALPIAARLRSAKADVALITALADLSGAWPLERVTRALADFADAALDASIAAALAEREAPNTGFVALALGKLGSFELNYSSDVDLILLYDPGQIPVRPREEVADAAVRIARRIVALMADPVGGYVFRVDLRLRPSAEITPIALPVAAAEHYYQSEAETWERTAFIRARACAGDIALGDGFLAAIRPFVWRRSLDYTALRDIQAVSLRIRDHFAGQAVGPGYDLKRGRGGIREVEFFAQIHQLVWGGRDAALQAPATLDALAALAAAGRIADDDAAVLSDAYRFLRTLEHRVQMIADAQTHAVPTTAAARNAVARLAGAADWRPVERELKRHTAAVATRYDRLIADAGGGARGYRRAASRRGSGARNSTPVSRRWLSDGGRAAIARCARTLRAPISRGCCPTCCAPSVPRAIPPTPRRGSIRSSPSCRRASSSSRSSAPIRGCCRCSGASSASRRFSPMPSPAGRRCSTHCSRPTVSPRSRRRRASTPSSLLESCREARRRSASTGCGYGPPTAASSSASS